MNKHNPNKQLTEDGILSLRKDGDCDYYIFKTVSGDVGFVQIDEEMEQLNNYCWLITQSVQNKISNLNAGITEAKDNPDKVIGLFDGTEITNNDTLNGMEEYVLPIWKDTKSFILPATCNMLLYILVEKSLKHLCNYCKGFVKETDIQPKQVNGLSKVESYLEYLKREFFPELKIDKKTLDLIHRSQKIRNAYAHGDWDIVRSEMASVNLVDAFITSASLFYSIEKQYDLWEKTRIG
jgi:hypothetical protein